MSARLMLVDDDSRIANLVAEYLRREGFEVDIRRDGHGTADHILRSEPDLVVLDLMLPGDDGLTICRKIRTGGYAGPVLMMTARGDEIDQVVGLEMGADDYVGKPVSPRLLLARVRALLRRRVEPEAPTDSRSCGPMVADQARRAVTVGGSKVDVTTAEFDLLWALLANPGRPVTREDLVRDLRGINYNGVDRSIDVRVSQLRKKLRKFPTAPEIKTVRSVGYQLIPA